MTTPVTIGRDSQPSLASFVRLRFDKTRDCWVLLAPERVLMPDAVAVEVLQHLDGTRSVAEVAERLATNYDAAPEEIAADVTAMLQDLADKGFLKA